MKCLFLFLFLFSALMPLSYAAGDGTYGNETYGNSAYGISSLANASFTNDSVTLEQNTPLIINATVSGSGQSAPNVVLELASNSNVSGSISIIKYETRPPNVGTNTFSGLDSYIDIVADGAISNSLNHSIITMYYSDSEVSNANIQENTLRLSKWNSTHWIRFEAPIGGVDVAANFVWANTSGFSTWGLFGNPLPQEQSGSENKPKVDNGASGSGYTWTCTDWSECVKEGTQSRKCNKVAGNGPYTKPSELRTCTQLQDLPGSSDRTDDGSLDNQVQSFQQESGAMEMIKAKEQNLFRIMGMSVKNINSSSLLSVLVFAAAIAILGLIGYKASHKSK